MTVRTRTAKLNAPALTIADVEALSAAKKEPRWLLESRLAAWELYAEMPMPSLEAEEWRRTDYTKIRWEDAGILTTGGRGGFEAILRNTFTVIDNRYPNFLRQLLRSDFNNTICRRELNRVGE